MGYWGGWGNLRNNLENTRDNIALAKKRGYLRSPKKIKINEAAKNRKPLSLVDLRKKHIARVRVIYTLMIFFMAILIYYFLL